MTDFNNTAKLWKKYNKASKELTESMSSTTNEVGEFAELLAAKYYKAERLPVSNKSADLITPDKKLIQVKSRKLDKICSTSLNVIRSWDFNFLVVIIFNKDGDILKAIEIGVDEAKDLARDNQHQNGDILTTNKELLNHEKAKDITQGLKILMKA